MVIDNDKIVLSYFFGCIFYFLGLTYFDSINVYFLFGMLTTSIIFSLFMYKLLLINL